LFIFDCRFAQESPGEISVNAQKHPKICEYVRVEFPAVSLGNEAALGKFLSISGFPI